ncbi:MAG: alginate lyase family protein [candidate division NC10 bacterium]|nr:alginate lyase family protein [candidate division NC10 bacterium]
MRQGLRYLFYRARRLTLPGAAAALGRKGRQLLGGLTAEALAHWRRVGSTDRMLRSALRPDSGGVLDPFSGEGGTHGSRFFLADGDRDRLIGRLRTEYPEAIPTTIRAADAVCDHRIDLLGSGPTLLGSEIDWHRDFKSGYRWNPRTFYKRVRFGDVAGVDVKVPWELSRFQHLATLGKAYWLTGEDRYAGEFVAQVTHWVAQNPPPFGVNWICSMDVAIRAFNWLWGYAFFRHAPQITPAFRRLFAGSLLAHGRHIMQNLERGADGVSSNHYLADLTGLLALGIACPAFREAEAWRRFALDELCRELESQVHPDGGDYESSIPYHRLVTEMFLAVALLCQKNDIPVPATFRQRLERMLEFALWYTKPNGLAPQVGDNDDGRLHILAEYGTGEPRDHRHLLATGGAFFDREDFSAAGAQRAEEALWLHGGLRPARGPSPPPPGSRAFPESGIYLMREGDLYLLVACGPVGTRGIGNHKHNDLLSFELHADGQDLLVDPGSFVYTPDPASRNRFRSTGVHNTVVIDGAEQNRFGEEGLFWLHADATPHCLAWETGPEVDLFAGEHDGYARLADPVIHRREFRLLKKARRLEIADGFRGTGRHTFTWNFTLAPGVTLRLAGEGRWELAGRSARAVLTREPTGPGDAASAVRVEVAEAFVSPRYGIKEKTTALRLHLVSGLPVQCRFRIEVH